MIKKIIFLASVLLLTGCYDADTATAVLSDTGYTDVHIHGYSFNACPKNDVYSTSFSAYSPSGKWVSGAVCSNIFVTYSTVNQISK